MGKAMSFRGGLAAFFVLVASCAQAANYQLHPFSVVGHCGTGRSTINASGVFVEQQACSTSVWLMNQENRTLYACAALHAISASWRGSTELARTEEDKAECIPVRTFSVDFDNWAASQTPPPVFRCGICNWIRNWTFSQGLWVVKKDTGHVHVCVSPLGQTDFGKCMDATLK
jgi:hypothetical protein